MTSAWVSRFSVNQAEWNTARSSRASGPSRASARTPKVARSATALSTPKPVMNRRKAGGRSTVGRRSSCGAGRSWAKANWAASKHRFCASTCTGSIGRKGSISPAASMARTLPRLEERVTRR